jgi:hypothetical protein
MVKADFHSVYDINPTYNVSFPICTGFGARHPPTIKCTTTFFLEIPFHYNEDFIYLLMELSPS